ncbi:MAG TPA: hypothetical protein VGC56_07250 [Allosphingosinicella sp.]|jgi:voltage-gated potassium channel
MPQETSKLDRLIKDVAARYPHTLRIGRALLLVLLILVSPTFLIAHRVKPIDKEWRSIILVALNLLFLIISLSTVAVLIYLGNSLCAVKVHAWSPLLLWAWYLWSRCAEVLIAFYRDAMDRLTGKPAASDLTASWRVWLALNSYLELIIDYALLYALLPGHMWKDAPTKVTEVLWISASTITTSGSGGFTLTHWLPQLLSTFEIIGGVILLVVCFALYTGGRGDARPS